MDKSLKETAVSYYSMYEVKLKLQVYAVIYWSQKQILGIMLNCT